MYQVDLIKGEIPKQREVNKMGLKMQICKFEIVGALKYGKLATKITQFGFSWSFFQGKNELNLFEKDQIRRTTLNAGNIR
jgi:hypothetical protein